LGKFVSGYKGLQLTSSTLQYPGKTLYTNGDVCPKGTPDSGKAGVVIVDYWPSFSAKGKGTQPSGDPQDLLFTNGQLITMAFIPATATVPKPTRAIAALITALESASVSTTTTLPTTATTTPSTTTTTPSTTTTAPSTSTSTTSGSK
jgi:serine/threonine-protein kinase